MRDAIEIFEYADHLRSWSVWVGSLFHKLIKGLHWAGAAFPVHGSWRAG